MGSREVKLGVSTGQVGMGLKWTSGVGGLELAGKDWDSLVQVRPGLVVWRR